MTAFATGLAAFGAAFLIAACSNSAKWQNPRLPAEMWNQDEATCRRSATAEVERELARDQAYHGDPLVGRDRTSAAQMVRFATTKRRQTLFERCMKAQGYEKAKAGTRE